MDQSRAFRRATLRSPLLLLFLIATLGLPLLFMPSAWMRPERLRRHWAPIEARIPVADPDTALDKLRKGLRRQAVYVDDVRGRASMYTQPWENAPLRLPLEFSVEGGEGVLRGSASHVQRAMRLLRSP